MIIGVDMDGCIVDWGEAWDTLLNSVQFKTGRGKSVPRHAQQRSFNLKDGVDPGDLDVVDLVMDTLDYSNMLPLPGAIQALEEMVAAGHEVFLVTSPTDTNPGCVRGKYSWVEKYLGEEWISKVIITHHKWLVKATFLFDDRYPIPNAAKADWQQIVVAQPYNRRSISHLPRLSDWADWARVIEGELI